MSDHPIGWINGDPMEPFFHPKGVVTRAFIFCGNCKTAVISTVGGIRQDIWCEKCTAIKCKESTVRLENTQEILSNVHSPEACKGQPCTIHNRTNHHMRSWPQHWRDDRKMMERICPHGVGHPDPDELPSIDTVHGCCGCCAKPDSFGNED